jgi:hypothetical protein
MATINTSIENNLIDNKSFAVLRTNPKLTSNVKLLVSSLGDLFLSSFRANKELSRIEYQKYEVNHTGRYSYDVASFYKGLPLTQRYQTLRTYPDTTVYSDYAFQYEDQYIAGAIQNSTKLYDEQYKIFAPLWLEKKIPTKFVIYRVENTDYSAIYPENNDGQTGRILELLKNATIIKTFDLGKSSKLGEYLNNHVNDKYFPLAPLSVNFKEGSQSTYNGIDIVQGGFTSKAEQFDKYYTQVDYPEIFSNEIITNGFERNGIVSANLINLEFLFDDADAVDYKIYRYFGLYVDEVEEGSFYSDGINPGGAISIKSNTYKSFYDLQGTSLTDDSMIPSASEFDIPALRYVKDKNGDFYNLIGAGDSPYKKLLINLDKTKLDLFEGYSKNGKKITSVKGNVNPRGFIKITVKDVPSINDRIFIADKTELEISGYNLGDYIIIASSNIQAGRANGNQFSNQGSLQQIAIAIAAAINNGEIVSYKTYVSDTSVIIEDYAAGNRRRQNVLGVYIPNLVDFVDITSGEYNNVGLTNSIVPSTTNTVFTDWNLYTMIGGSSEGQCILVQSSEIGNVLVGEWVKQKDSNNFIQIIEIEKDPLDTDVYRIILNSGVDVSNDGIFEIYDIYSIIHGRFLVYDIKDFDFDFYSTRNSDLGDLQHDEKIVSGNPTRNIKTFYLGLSGVLESEKIDTDSGQQNINNEYDRLNENQLKETALLSRVVPTICKFELKDSSNARNLPYILNASEAFGEDNLSPNIEIDSPRKVEYMNMEHFHINKIPASLKNNSGVSGFDFNNYLDFADDGGITINKLKSVDFNYFDRHFNWNGYFGKNKAVVTPPEVQVSKWYDNKYKKLWTKFDIGNSEKNSSTVFRGLRYEYLKRKETASKTPTEFITDSNINDYKFGVVFSYNVSTDSDGALITTNSLNVTSVKNEKFKFICILVELNMVNNDVKDIDRYDLYTLKNINFNNLVVDTKLDFYIDFPNSTFSSVDPNAEATLIASDFSLVSPDFNKFVKQNEYGEYSWIYFSALGGTYAVKVVNIIDEQTITVSGHPYAFNPFTGEVDASYRINPSQFSLISIQSDFYYYYGGENGFNDLLNEINAYNFAKRFNKFGEVEYVTISENGDVSYNEYVLSIESGVDVIKPSLIKSENDPEKPKAYQLSTGDIGSVIVDRTDGGYITLLRRMNGDYNPLFNNIVTFSDVYSAGKVVEGLSSSKSKLIYNKFNDTGISFDSYKLNNIDYGYIKNYFYHKTNDEDSKNILKLSQTSDKLPLYPAIGEVAIDKKDINIFKSKYATDYFTKSLAAGKSENVYGTLSPIEKKSFLASTIMKVKDNYDITKFTNIKETSIEALDKIRINNASVETIHWYEDDSQVIADFYLPDAILNELNEDGIKKYFNKYVNSANSFGDKSTIEDDLKLYAKSNISPRFITDGIFIYGIEGKDLQTDFVSVLEVADLTSDNFKQLTNFNIQSYQNDGLSFRLIYNKRLGYSYNFKIHVKIQA